MHRGEAGGTFLLCFTAISVPRIKGNVNRELTGFKKGTARNPTESTGGVRAD